MKPIRTHKVKSRTREGKIHLISEYQDGRLTCSCEGFTNRGKCWAAEEIKENWRKADIKCSTEHKLEDVCSVCYECITCRKLTGYSHGGCSECVEPEELPF